MELLVKKAKKGDSEAFITLIEKNKVALKRVAFAYLKNEEDVADAIQDTILSAYEHIESLKKAEYFRTWIIRILINNCTKIYRRNRKHVNYESNAEEYGESVMEACYAEAAHADLEFYDLLRALPEESRLIFQLYFGEQFTTAEIAKLLHMNENTVKSKIHRGKELLKGQI